jgi:hypothetical protein
MSGLTSNPFMLIGGSFAFAVGLAWNDLITAVIKQYYTADNTIKARAIWCVMLTVIIVSLTLILNYLNIKSQQIKSDMDAHETIKANASKYAEQMTGQMANRRVTI